MPNRFQGLHLLINCSIMNMLATSQHIFHPTPHNIQCSCWKLPLHNTLGVGDSIAPAALPTLRSKWEMDPSGAPLNWGPPAPQEEQYGETAEYSAVVWRERTHMSTHPRQRTHDRPKCGYKRVSFIGVTYRNVGEDLQEQKWLRGSCITKAQPSMGDSWSTLHSAKAAEQVGVFPSDSTVLNLTSSAASCSFQAPGLIARVVFAAWLSENLLCSFHCLFWQEGACWTWSVLGTSWSYLFWVIYLPCLRHLQVGWNECFKLGGNYYTSIYNQNISNILIFRKCSSSTSEPINPGKVNSHLIH
jgi:hypothetical protein